MSQAATCCFTGHRTLPGERLAAIEAAIGEQLQAAIREGYTHFLCGMASGADLLFAKAVAAQKQQHPITLEAAIPYPGRLNTPDALFRELIACCDRVTTHSQAYHPGCYHLRNRRMVESSSRLIAVYNGEATGGTASTLRYARKQGLEIFIIPV